MTVEPSLLILFTHIRITLFQNRVMRKLSVCAFFFFFFLCLCVCVHACAFIYVYLFSSLCEFVCVFVATVCLWLCVRMCACESMYCVDVEGVVHALNV